jgi:hypothetical protein
LGERFRFFHVEGVTGGKAGALNIALARTDLRAELIATVDADNQVTPDFLERLVGHFEDPKLGFIQAQYDFRDADEDPYLQACYRGLASPNSRAKRVTSMEQNDSPIAAPDLECCATTVGIQPPDVDMELISWQHRSGEASMHRSQTRKITVSYRVKTQLR